MESSVTSNVYEKTSSHSRRPFEAGRTPFDGLRLWSAITHGVGILLAMVGTVFLLIKTVPVQDAVRIASFAVFGASMVGLYTASTLYHSVRVGVTGRILLRKVDHTAVYLLIAGTYTPLCMTILNGPLGYTLLAIIWILAIAGGAMSCLWINAPRDRVSIYCAGLVVRHCPAVYLSAGGMDAHFVDVCRRYFVYYRRRIVCAQMARTPQSPVWMPRNISCIYRSWNDCAFYACLSLSRVLFHIIEYCTKAIYRN